MRSRSRVSACSASLGSVGVTGVGSTVGGAGSMTGASGSVLPAQPASRHSAASSAKIFCFMLFSSFVHCCRVLLLPHPAAFPDFTMPRAQTQPAAPRSASDFAPAANGKPLGSPCARGPNMIKYPQNPFVQNHLYRNKTDRDLIWRGDMKKKALKAALAFFICWVFFVALEGLLLIGSTDPGKAPFIVLGGAHIADEIDAYSSLGFSQTYYLTYPDSFVSGEFKVFGVKVAGWER